MKTPDFVHWMKQHQDLPWFRPKPAPMDDSDVDFHSDIQYLHLLLDDIWENAYYTGHKLIVPNVFFDYMATMAAAMNAMNRAVLACDAAFDLFLVDWRESFTAVTA
jgi:hypothetical protein